MKVLTDPSSGSYQGLTHSHNRYGQYVRTRAIPVNPGTSWQSLARTRLATSATDYRSLTALQQAGWIALGAQMQRQDPLGQTYTLTGLQAFASVNGILDLTGGARVTDAPAHIVPATLDTVTPTATAATLSIAFTPTPLDTGEKLVAYLSQGRSPGRNFEGDIRFILAGAAASASPLNVFSAWTTRFGTPVVGQRIFIAVAVALNGFLSAPLRASCLVTT